MAAETESRIAKPLGTGARRIGTHRHQGIEHTYQSRGDWLTLRDDDQEPTASIFYTDYTLGAEVDPSRPITFVYNGGPGAASAFLHLGAAGPVRARFEDDGKAPPMPVQLVENQESWLPYTDIVFVDPVGAGFSRAISKSGETENESGNASEKSRTQKANEPFWEVAKDLDSLAEFIKRYLSENGRWLSPIVLAGESYGGYRVARLAKLLQDFGGIGLAGVVLISPAIEFDGLLGSDYDLTHWIETLPSMAACAHFHNLAGQGKTLDEHLADAENFVEGDFLRFLVRGEALESAERTRMVTEMARLIGLSPDYLDKQAGRISQAAFCRELLRGSGQLLGMHDSSIAGPDPFPDREVAPDRNPVMVGQSHLYSVGINAHLRDRIGVSSDLHYDLFNPVANEAWKNKDAEHCFEAELTSLDDVRFGMAANPHMQVHICYGYFDLVTPYYQAKRLSRQMRLSESQKTKLHLHEFVGGHMFYTYSESRKKLAAVFARLFGEK